MIDLVSMSTLRTSNMQASAKRISLEICLILQVVPASLPSEAVSFASALKIAPAGVQITTTVVAQADVCMASNASHRDNFKVRPFQENFTCGKRSLLFFVNVNTVEPLSFGSHAVHSLSQ
jgi:hypothetical protein